MIVRVQWLLAASASGHGRQITECNIVNTEQSICIKCERRLATLIGHSARKAITLIVEVANAGGAHMILVVLTVSLVQTA
jgi:hypothetical protein